MTARALIVDGDTTVLELITAVLTRSGFVVESTNDGADALSRFLDRPTELVVGAMDLSGVSGLQLCRHLRSQDQTVRIVLLSHTELTGADREALCGRLGCDAILELPFRFGPLKELLSSWGLLVEANSTSGATNTTFAVPAPPPVIALPALATPAAPNATAPAPPPPEPSLGDAGATTAPVPLPIPVAEAVGQKMDVAEPGLVAEVVGATSAALDTARSGSASPSPRRDRGSGLPPSVPRFGDLTSMPLPRLVFELYLGTYTGKLHLIRKGAHRTLYLMAGMPVRVDSEQLAESLGVLLRETGRITEQQCEAAQRLALERRIALGEALVSSGVISERELLQALAAQTEQKLVNTFSWRDGTYRIEDDTTFDRESVLNEVSPLRLIWRGIREHYDLMALLKFFAAHRRRYVVATEMFAAQLEVFAPFLRNLQLEPALNGKTTFEAALQIDDAHSVEIAQTLYALLVTDMIRPSEKPGAAAQLTRPKADQPPSTVPVDYRQIMEAADRLAREYLRIKGHNYFEILNLRHESTSEEVDAAFRTIHHEVNRDASVSGLPHDAQKQGREILATLTRARNTLVQPKRRDEYLRNLPGPTEPAAAPGELTLDGGPDATHRESLYRAEQAYKEGQRLLEVFDHRGARVQFELALRDNPGEPTYHVALAQAVLAAHVKDPGAARPEALRHLETALRLDPGNVLANLEAAKILAAEQHPDEARAHVERVLQRAPHHQLARKLLAELTPANPKSES